ncbi:TPA: hypothetical protein KD834_004608 [Vibrio parahaemolyticus]|nr:hypothetical protein [Vibrio parahaemolyticus]
MYKILVVNAAAPHREFGYLTDGSDNDVEFDNIEAAKAFIEKEKEGLSQEERLQFAFVVADKDGNRVK